ncbi:MAG: hypothetical protein AAFY29_21385 [Pseudomonadota bacterium]
MKTLSAKAADYRLPFTLLCLAGALLSGCASKPPCIQYELREVQTAQYTRGHGSYGTTREVAVCTARAMAD